MFQTIQPTNAKLSDLIENNRLIFHQSREVNCLKQHWLLLKKLNLLADQQNETTVDDITESFEDKEKKLDDREIIESVHLNVEIEEGTFNIIFK